jgi:hypothetical protein
MANREQRSSREKRKPKAKKPKTPVGPAAPFGRIPDGGNPKGSAGKKAR